MLEINKIYNEDCLEGMKRISDKSIDMIFCDLPYGKIRTRWDVLIDSEKLWREYRRIIKDSGAIILTGNEPFSSLMRVSAIDLYRYDWKWIKNKTTSFANANFRPMAKYEDLMVFSKKFASAGAKKDSMPYFPQGLIEVNKVKKNSKNRQGLASYETNNVGKNNALEQETNYIQKNTNYPSNILYFDCEKKYIHPTQKPTALLEYLIKTYTNENELVLDNCIGSGTTAIAALNTNRRYIGFELDENYFNIANDRIDKHINSMNNLSL